MKKAMLLSVPTAKLQIGNQGSIELDTTTHNGKKSIKIIMSSENDSVTKIIDNVAEEINDEIEQNIENIHDDTKGQFWESQVELEKVKNESFQEKIGIFIPIIAIIAVFSYLAFRAYQSRKWKEALLNKGLSVDEIEKLDNKANFMDNKLKENDVIGYEKRKMLKYAIVFGSLGIALLIGTMMHEFGYFAGSLFLLLGLGFWYYNDKTS